MKAYEAKATRDGRFWLIEVPEIAQYTQARNVGEADTMVRDLISIIQEVPVDSFEVAIAWEMPAVAAEHLAAAELLRAASMKANRDAAEEVRLAAQALKDTGMPLRDIGKVMGVSHQRVFQLVNETVGAPSARHRTAAAPRAAAPAKAAAARKAAAAPQPATVPRALSATTG